MNNTESTKIGNQIRNLRNLRGMYLSELQEKTGIHYTWLSRIETGKAIPTEDELERIKAALSWPSDDAVEAAFALLQGESAQ